VFCVPDMDAYDALIAGAFADYPRFHQTAMQKRAHYLQVHATFEPSPDSARNIVATIAAHSAHAAPRARSGTA
jgi:hypothetical protein